MKYNIVSFNVSKNKRLMDLAFDYLSKTTDTILFLQETNGCKAPSNSVYYTPNASNPTAGMMIVMSANLGANPTNILPNSITKCTSHSLMLPIGDCCLVNVHMPPRSTKENRDFYYLRIVDKIKEKIKSISPQKKIVIGGDFNENPFDRMMSVNEAWSAKRSMIEASATKGHIMSFYNPFWNYLKRPEKRTISGTILASGAYPMDMSLFDQFIVSEKIGNGGIMSFGIIENMCGLSIAQLNQSISGSHWPVHLTIEI